MGSDLACLAQRPGFTFFTKQLSDSDAGGT